MEIIKMIELVFAFMNAMNNNNKRAEEQKRQQEQEKEKCRCHPLAGALKKIKEVIEEIENDKKQLEFHQAHFKEMYKFISGLIEPQNKPEEAPEKTPAPKPDAKTEPLSQAQKPEPATPPESTKEGSRLKQLEQGLYNAVAVLSGTKMASHFKTIKQLLADLTALADADEMPEVERVADLKAGLQNTVDVLGNDHCSSRAKVTQELRNAIIELLGSSTK